MVTRSTPIRPQTSGGGPTEAIVAPPICRASISSVRPFDDPTASLNTLTASKPLRRALRAMGVTNARVDRRHTLTGRGRFAAAAAAYEPMRRADGKLPSSWEVIYAHAWAPDPGAPIREGGHDVASVPVSAIPIRRRQT